MTEPPPFSIGSDTWPGLAKIAEEAGEVLQVIGKLLAYPDGQFPDGTDLRWALTIEYAVKENALQAPVRERMAEKRGRYRKWHCENRGVVA